MAEISAEIQPHLGPSFAAGPIPCQVHLQQLSFGAAQSYRRQGGQRIIADASAEDQPVDISRAGLDLPRSLGRGEAAVGAFTIGNRSLQVHLHFQSESCDPEQIWVRAHCAGEPRVRESRIDMENGSADVDLPVVGIATDCVQIVNEKWTWEIRAGAAGYVPLGQPYLGGASNALPVRIYIVAGEPLNAQPRESFYHITCSIRGARNASEALRDVWKYFTGMKQGKPVTNARGESLGFWRERKPGLNNSDYISRNARDLITRTDSSCRGWAELFREALEIHGISATVRAVQPKLTRVHPHLGLPTFMVPDGNGGSTVMRTIGILVKPFQWKPREQISPFPFGPNETVVNPGKFLWKIDNPVDPKSVRWPERDVTDLLRVSHCTGGSATVHGMFGNHAVVLVQQGQSQAWYDPSFGFGPHDSLQSYENELLGRGEPNPGGLFAIIGWKKETRPDPTTGQLQEVNAGMLLGAAPAPPGPLLEAVDPA